MPALKRLRVAIVLAFALLMLALTACSQAEQPKEGSDTVIIIVGAIFIVGIVAFAAVCIVALLTAGRRPQQAAQPTWQSTTTTTTRRPANKADTPDTDGDGGGD